jgi:uncharacterized membrane protein
MNERAASWRIVAEFAVIGLSVVFFLTHIRLEAPAFVRLIGAGVVIALAYWAGYRWARFFFPPAGSKQAVQKALPLVGTAVLLLVATQISSEDGMVLGTGLLAITVSMIVGSEVRNQHSGGAIFRDAA